MEGEVINNGEKGEGEGRRGVEGEVINNEEKGDGEGYWRGGEERRDEMRREDR